MLVSTDGRFSTRSRHTRCLEADVRVVLAIKLRDAPPQRAHCQRSHQLISVVRRDLAPS